MKGYDWSKKRATPGKKDKQWDWTDEEIERIWDAIYNHRFQYPNQLGGNSSTTFPSPENRTWGFWNVASVGAGGGTPNNIGILPAPTPLGTATAVGNLQKSFALFAQRDTATTAGAAAGWHSGANANTDAAPNFFRISQKPSFMALIFTGATIDTNFRLFSGFSGRPAFANNASGQVDTISTGFYFVYNENQTYWQVVATAGTTPGNGFITNSKTGTSAGNFNPVLTNSFYVLKLDVRPDLILEDADAIPTSGVLLTETYRIVPTLGDGVLYNVNDVVSVSITDHEYNQYLYNSGLINSNLSMGCGMVWYHNAAGGTLHRFGMNKIYVETNATFIDAVNGYGTGIPIQNYGSAGVYFGG